MSLQSQELTQYLFKYFKYTSFREPQENIVKDAIKGLDQFVLLPTGTGKSLCYQLPAIIQGGITIVISPLKSLIEDQLENLKLTPIKAVGYYSDTTSNEKSTILRDMISSTPSFQIIYTTPETMDKSHDFLEYLNIIYNNGKLTRFVIDEAHCISLWGNDFRSSYRKLGSLKNQFSKTPIMACTASATNQVRKDMLYLLNINTSNIYTISYYRSNLNIIVKNRSDKTLDNIISKLQNKYIKQSGIIYCISRKNCEKLANQLSEYGISAEAYHAGLTPLKRRSIQSSWKDNVVQIIVATVAFGMGIDKPDVRFVIHYNTPSSLESYYQEIGRAGRDGLPSDCILYYSYQDKIISEKMLRENNLQIKNDKYIDHQIDKLNNVINYAENNIDCRHCQLSNYLGELKSNEIDNCGKSCDNCIKRDSLVYTDVSSVAIVIFESIMSLKQLEASKQKIKYEFTKHSKFASLLTQYEGYKSIIAIYDRIFTYLIVNKYIKETLERNSSGFWTEKYLMFSKSKTVIDNQTRIKLYIQLAGFQPITNNMLPIHKALFNSNMKTSIATN